jgi:hypothetical protein
MHSFGLVLAHLSFSDHTLSFVCLLDFYISTSSPEPLDQFNQRWHICRLRGFRMGFITAVTALTPEVGGASENRDLSFRRNSITSLAFQKALNVISWYQ